MNPYYILGVIAVSLMIYGALVSLVTLTGLSVVAAMITVYAAMFGFMLSMQRRARLAYLPKTFPGSSANSQSSFEDRRKNPMLGTAAMLDQRVDQAAHAGEDAVATMAMSVASASASVLNARKVAVGGGGSASASLPINPSRQSF